MCFKGMVSARVKMEQAYLLSLDIVGDQWYTKPGVGLVVRAAAWDPRVLSSSPVGPLN